MTRLPRPPLLVVTDRTQAVRPLEAVAAAAFRGGCRWISLREKDLDPGERRCLLERLAEAAAPFGSAVGVHDDLKAAALCAGVHLPAGGDVGAARRALGARALVGVSTHSIDAAAAAEQAGADYVTLSPVFETASKPGYGPAVGLAALAAAALRLSIPVLALGGVRASTIRACLDAGAAGVAVMGEVMRAPDPEATTAGLLAAAGWPPVGRVTVDRDSLGRDSLGRDSPGRDSLGPDRAGWDRGV
ncbi:MAG: thiamine phosphate synthase [Alphaproteobacteria bacterium]